MKQRKIIIQFAILAVTIVFSYPASSQAATLQGQSDPSVKIVGEMRKVMRNGELFATIEIDTLSSKQHLYGLGPMENLSGEILLIDGKGYKSTVVNDTVMQVTETFKVKAPFFVYANIDHWTEIQLPDSILTLPQLENYLYSIRQKFPGPFCFRLSATVDSSAVHIVNLPAGTKISSPEEAQQGQKDYFLADEEVEIVGFFSTEHQGIFTHHDSFVHCHLITADRQRMGHLYELKIRPGTAKLFLPIQ